MSVFVPRRGYPSEEEISSRKIVAIPQVEDSSFFEGSGTEPPFPIVRHTRIHRMDNSFAIDRTDYDYEGEG